MCNRCGNAEVKVIQLQGDLKSFVAKLNRKGFAVTKDKEMLQDLKDRIKTAKEDQAKVECEGYVSNE